MTETWHEAAPISAFDKDEVIGVTLEGRMIAIYQLDDGFYATDDICSHGYAKLSDGYLDDGVVECPLHAGCFEVRTGKAVMPPCTVDIATYRVKVEGDRVFVALAA